MDQQPQEAPPINVREIAIHPNDLPAIRQRFFAKVDKTPGHGPWGNCWIWTASRSNNGYGYFQMPDGGCGAHRASFYLHYGHWPLRFALHGCDVRACVNPEHLRDGAPIENAADMVARGRQSRGSSHNSSILRRLKGEQVKNSKLTEAAVLRIRSAVPAVKGHKVEIKALMDEFSVSRTAIWQVIRRERWAWL